MFTEWKTAMRAELGRITAGFEDRHGYPPGENVVTDGSGAIEPALPPVLAAFYAEVGEVLLPDVHVGYFVQPAEGVILASERGRPTTATGLGEIAAFATDGGGNYYALALGDGSVHFLPAGELLYDAVWHGEPERRFDDFPAFLDWLLSQTRNA